MPELDLVRRQVGPHPDLLEDPRGEPPAFRVAGRQALRQPNALADESRPFDVIVCPVFAGPAPRHGETAVPGEFLARIESIAAHIGDAVSCLQLGRPALGRRRSEGEEAGVARAVQPLCSAEGRSLD